MSRRLILLLAGLLGPYGIAQGAQWDLMSTPTSTSNCTTVSGASLACGKMVFTVNGYAMSVRAFTTNANNNGTSPAGKLAASTLVQWSGGGLGIQNTLENPVESGQPEHAADNKDRYDVFVFEALGASNDKFDWQSVALGWAQEWNAAVTPNTYAQADIQFYVGNGNGANGATNFTNMCLVGCANNSENITANNFTKFDPILDVAQGATANVNDSGTKGRYLVVSGALDLGGGSGLYDAFKLTSVKGVPEPNALALLSMGMLAMVGLRRRRSRV